MFSKWRSRNFSKQAVEIKAPVSGKAVPLADVPDEAFAAGHMGLGAAIEPNEGRLIAPFNGTVAHVIKSNHAVMLEQEGTGLQFLFHIGINTVALKGEGFTSHISAGQKVKQGQLLIEFDLDRIKEAGYPVITPVILTNAAELAESVHPVTGKVTAGQDILLTAVLQK
ncbi:PTS sugar transporter subunit IIA [Paenibacillus pinistramenti]|uniref:PTS sugar transporter subunit IIA n=1 Tax=Paenibacillus pinistramenti TaxID=1768003 RepID=UPI001108CFC1|nr:PTS glucose transporter subunit IIA [Paenibacillus pinistramenti]